MESASDVRRLGDYLLKERLADRPPAYVWTAEQLSIGREVLVHELRADCTDRRAEFLADVRAKASVDHPLIGSVYEAVDRPDCCFCAFERIGGTRLSERLDQRRLFVPLHLVDHLGKIAAVQLQLEMRGINAEPLTLANLHLDSHGSIRMDNLALAGERPAETSRRDIVALGQALAPLVSSSRPGSTRVLTLLGWMRGEGLAAPITWSQVEDYCAQIKAQLSAPVAPPKPGAGAALPWIVLAAAVVIVGVTAVILTRSRAAPEVVTQRVPLPEPLTIPAGQHPAPDGGSIELAAFRITPYEITIGEYAEFLATLELLAKDHRQTVFDDSEQPPEKVSHEPDGWTALHAAAQSGGSWQHRAVTLDSPVVGVDWWDASAYAKWKQGRLPTQEEWTAALYHGGSSPGELAAGPWQSVTATTSDATPGGMLGMAGSVSEWTHRQATNPANPLGPKRWVIIGGSHLRPANGALTREWIDDRSARRADLGFRIVFGGS
jgi:hypothetical protein